MCTLDLILLWYGPPTRILWTVWCRRRHWHAARGYGWGWNAVMFLPRALMSLDTGPLFVAHGRGDWYSVHMASPQCTVGCGFTHSISGRRHATSTHCISGLSSISHGLFDVLYHCGAMWKRFPCVRVVLIFRLYASASTGPPPPDHLPDHLVNFQPQPSTANMVSCEYQGY